MSDAVELAFDDDGLVPAVAQDAETGEVLMLAYASPAAVEATLATGEAHYYSRSRGELWHKGASSGHVQRVESVRVDCDADALLYVVEQEGGACHTGYRSCFHRAVAGIEDDEEVDEREGERAVRSGEDQPAVRSGEGDGEVRSDETERDVRSDADLRVAVETVGEEVFDPDVVYD